MPSSLRPDDLVSCGLPAERASAALVRAVASWAASLSASDRWQRLVQEGWLPPDVPFAVHLHLHDHVFAGWDERRGPRPAWIPSPESAARTNIGALLREKGFAGYDQAYAWSIQDRAVFWEWAVGRLGLHPARALDARARR